MTSAMIPDAAIERTGSAAVCGCAINRPDVVAPATRAGAIFAVGLIDSGAARGVVLGILIGVSPAGLSPASARSASVKSIAGTSAGAAGAAGLVIGSITGAVTSDATASTAGA